MEIIYPPLVEQGLAYFFKTTKLSLDRCIFYRSMVEKGIITETGLPTRMAFEKGLVKNYYQDEELTSDTVFNINPIFELNDKRLFKGIDGSLEIPNVLKEKLVSQLESGILTFKGVKEIQMHLKD